MTRRAPWHSERPGALVYHDNDKCEDGQAIALVFRAEGTAGRPLCKACAKLDAGEGESTLFERDRW